MMGFSQFIKIFNELVLTPGLPLRVGMMIGAAIILGYLLFDNYRIWLKLFITGTVFVIFNEWMRMELLKNVTEYLPSAVIALAAAIIYGLSVGFGAFMRARKMKEHREVENRADKAIKKIRNNGPTGPQ